MREGGRKRFGNAHFVKWAETTYGLLLADGHNSIPGDQTAFSCVLFFFLSRFVYGLDHSSFIVLSIHIHTHAAAHNMIIPCGSMQAGTNTHAVAST